MDLPNYFPIWNSLTKAEQEQLLQAAVKRKVKRGTLLHNGSSDCIGLLVVCSGQLRIFTISEEGREITVYRLFEQDICLFSAACVMQNIQFDISVEAEKDSELWIIPSDVYKGFMTKSAVIANFTNQIMASRFSEVMWLMEQIMWRSVDKRLAEFLLEESEVEGSSSLKITHEKIANHMGTAREVITRMLRYFQEEKMVVLSRGVVELLDKEKLRRLAGA